MTSPTRIVDAHVHLWDPARSDWYPYLVGNRDLGMGDVSGMARRFDADTYSAEAGPWNVDKLVNVAAATGRHSVTETLELDRRAESEGQPAAIVGGLPHTDTIAEAIELIDEQLAAPRLRGVRPMATGSPVPDDEILAALAERGLLFELMAHPHELADAARRLAAHPDLTVVLEHTGWPRSAEDDEFRLWHDGIKKLAGTVHHLHCKLSGLAMPLGAMSVEAFRRWIDFAIEDFGVERCMFASNFPVDGLHGTLDQLWSIYSDLTIEFSDHERDLLFAGNAERVYRC
jgi:L-fuconolactonase